MAKKKENLPDPSRVRPRHPNMTDAEGVKYDAKRKAASEAVQAVEDKTEAEGDE